MQKNLYYRSVIRRKNLIGTAINDFFFYLASYPRLLLEVFIKKNMGERYFSFATAITVFVVVALIPLLGDFISNLFWNDLFGDPRPSEFRQKYLTWYLFLFAFFIFALKRRHEIGRNPSTFEFGRYSLYSGDTHPLVKKVTFLGPLNARLTETLVEPGFCFIIGLVFYLFGQNVGMLLMVSAICYGLSYAAAYRRGDNFILDTIDEMIVNEEMQSSFVDDVKPDDTRGVKFYAKKPKARTLRKKLSDSFIEEIPEPEEVTLAD